MIPFIIGGASYRHADVRPGGGKIQHPAVQSVRLRFVYWLIIEGKQESPVFGALLLAGSANCHRLHTHPDYPVNTSCPPAFDHNQKRDARIEEIVVILLPPLPPIL